MSVESLTTRTASLTREFRKTQAGLDEALSEEELRRRFDSYRADAAEVLAAIVEFLASHNRLYDRAIEHFEEE